MVVMAAQQCDLLSATERALNVVKMVFVAYMDIVPQ